MQLVENVFTKAVVRSILLSTAFFYIQILTAANYRI